MSAVRFSIHFVLAIAVATIRLTVWQILNAFIKCVQKRKHKKIKMATFDDSFALHYRFFFRFHAIVRNVAFHVSAGCRVYVCQ